MEDKRKENPKKTKRTEGFVNDIKEVVEADRRISVRKLASMFEVSKSTIHAILHDDLGLSKESARWVPKLLSDEQKAARVWSSQEFVRLVEEHGEEVLDRIVTMDKIMLSLFTPETKQASKQWVRRGRRGR